MEKIRKTPTVKHFDDLTRAVSDIKIPKQTRHLMIYSTAKDMIKMILANGGEEIERYKIDENTDYITYKL